MTTLGCPFLELGYDSSINGSTVMTGVYLNNTFITTGQSGFVDISYTMGQVYFSQPVNYPVSGSYSIKQIDVALTNEAEAVILFKNAYQLKPKFIQQATGVALNTVPYPVIFIKDDGGLNKPAALGGAQFTTSYIRIIPVVDSLFTLNAIESILKDTNNSLIALFNVDDMPFDALGGLNSGVFNYTGVANQKILEQSYIYIKSVMVARYNRAFEADVKLLNPDIYTNFIDLEVEQMRWPLTAIAPN